MEEFVKCRRVRYIELEVPLCGSISGGSSQAEPGASSHARVFLSLFVSHVHANRHSVVVPYLLPPSTS